MNTNYSLKTFTITLFAITLFASCNHEPKVNNEIGYASVGNIMLNLPQIKTAQTSLDSLQLLLNGPLQQRQARFRELVTLYQENSASLSEELRKYREQELVLIQDSLQKDTENSQKVYSDRRNELLAPIEQQVQRKIDSLAEVMGFKYVLNLDSGTPLLLVAPEENRLDTLVLSSLGIEFTQ